jgi:nitroimidazol reductase NimA-like FMN-containing flavoprotein (pyridoxamine 5'-phosphate oxidase superfamily)
MTPSLDRMSPSPSQPTPSAAPEVRSSSSTVIPASDRSTVKRLSERGSYDRDLAYAILDEGFVCHVGIAGDAGPVVIPTLYARDGDRLLIHGSPASRLLRTAATGAEVCLTVTLVDGLVLARSVFHHSANYRSVVVFGRATRLDDLGDRRAALNHIVERIVPGRTTDARPPSDKELRGTTVLALPLNELSVKVREGGVLDEPEDYELDVWAGVIPLVVTPGEPIPDPAMSDDAPGTPPYAAAYRRPRS